MPMTIDQADDFLKECAIRIGDRSMLRSTRHMAIIESCKEFLIAAPGSSVVTESLAITSGTHTLNITGASSTDRFGEEDFIVASISDYPVKLAPFHTVQRRHEGGSTAGRPTMIAFRANGSEAWFDKNATSGGLSLSLTYCKAFVEFLPGSRGNYSSTVTYQLDDAFRRTSTSTNYRVIATTGVTGVLPPNATYYEVVSYGTIVNPATQTLNVPDEWAEPIIKWGAFSHLFYGYSGHNPEVAAAMSRWVDLLNEVGKSYKTTKHNVRDIRMAESLRTSPRELQIKPRREPRNG